MQHYNTAQTLYIPLVVLNWTGAFWTLNTLYKEHLKILYKEIDFLLYAFICYRYLYNSYVAWWIIYKANCGVSPRAPIRGPRRLCVRPRWSSDHQWPQTKSRLHLEQKQFLKCYSHYVSNMYCSTIQMIPLTLQIS